MKYINDIHGSRYYISSRGLENDFYRCNVTNLRKALRAYWRGDAIRVSVRFQGSKLTMTCWAGQSDFYNLRRAYTFRIGCKLFAPAQARRMTEFLGIKVAGL